MMRAWRVRHPAPMRARPLEWDTHAPVAELVATRALRRRPLCEFLRIQLRGAAVVLRELDVLSSSVIRHSSLPIHHRLP